MRQLAAAFSPPSLLAGAPLHGLVAENGARLRNPASKLAGRKAAASCRTLKLRAHFSARGSNGVAVEEHRRYSPASRVVLHSAFSQLRAGQAAVPELACAGPIPQNKVGGNHYADHHGEILGNLQDRFKSGRSGIVSKSFELLNGESRCESQKG